MKRNSEGKFSKAYKVNELFFDKIDTEEKAYVLGFIYADGCNTLAKTIKITQLEQDIDILYKIQKAMKSNHVLGSEIQSTNNKVKKILNIYSPKLSEALNNIGVVHDKTNVLKFPTFIPKDLMRHFIRGYFDGDGCIWSGKKTYRDYIKKDGSLSKRLSWNTKFTFTGCESFIEPLQNYLVDNININKTKLNFSKRKKDSTTCTMEYSGRGNIKKLYDYMYKDSLIYGNRKRIKFEEIICANDEKSSFETGLIAGKPEMVISSQAEEKFSEGSTTIPEMEVESSDSKCPALNE